MSIIPTIIELTGREKQIMKPVNERFHIYSMDFNDIQKLSIKRLAFICNELAGRKTWEQWKDTGTWVKFNDMLLMNSNSKLYDKYVSLVVDFFNFNGNDEEKREYYRKNEKHFSEGEKCFIVHLFNMYRTILNSELDEECNKSRLKIFYNKYSDILKILEYQHFKEEEADIHDDIAQDIMDLIIYPIWNKENYSDKITDELYNVAETFYFLGKIFGKQIERKQNPTA